MAGYDKLTPEGEKFYAELKKLTESEVFIGYQAGKESYQTEDGREVDMAQIAAFNEFGTKHIPSRPFLRKSYDENKDKIAGMSEVLSKQLAEGGTAEKCLKQMGAFGVSLVQEKIRDGNFQKNSDITLNGGWIYHKESGKSFYIKGKGEKSTKPLIDTGRLRQSVHYVIKKKGSD